MIIDSKQLFQSLRDQFTSEKSQDERAAIIMLVMESALGLSMSEVMTGKKIESNPGQFSNVIYRLNQHEPVQYILGEANFYGRKFQVTPAVLIPRPETEMLIDSVLVHLKGSSGMKILDIGTGSACIAVTLALELKSAAVYATDVCDDALTIARLNSEKLGAAVHFYHHDILSDQLSLGEFDVIVSNPPYIPERQKDTLQKNVRDYEPGLALFVPGSEPLLFHKSIAEKSFNCLMPGGFLMTEIHESFGNETGQVFRSVGFENIKIIKDLSGKDRFVEGIKPV